MSLFNEILAGLPTVFGRSLIPELSSRVPIARDALNLANKYSNQATDIFNELESGDILSVAQRFIKGSGNFFNKRSKAFAGLSPAESFEIYKRQRGIRWCFKNLWFIEVSSALYDDSGFFNMICHTLDYSPFTVSGEKKQVGAAHVDLVNSSDPVELNMTTYDNKHGDIKRWFEDHASVCAASDGTVGLPSEYAIKIKITHAFVNRQTNQGGYVSQGIFRTGNITLNLARSEQALSEITMSFVQLDTFMGNEI